MDYGAVTKYPNNEVPFQPAGDLLRVEVKLDHVIKMLNAIHELINKPTI